MQRLPLKWIAIFSIATNLLMIVPPLHMLQIYDRVLTSKSMETLIYLTLIAVAAMVLYGAAEAVRGKLAQRAAAQYTVFLSDPLFKHLSGNTDGARSSSQVLRDFNSVRGFLSSRAMTGLFDLPFVSFFILLMFMLHWVLGAMTLIVTFALIGVAWFNKVSTAKNTDESKQCDMEALTFAHTVLMRAEDIRAMGLLPSVMECWGQKMATSRRGGANLDFLRHFQIRAQSVTNPDHGWRCLSGSGRGRIGRRDLCSFDDFGPGAGSGGAGDRRLGPYCPCPYRQ